MAGRMRKRQSALPRHARETYGMAKSFHAPQKDNSARQKKKAKLNDHKDQSHQSQPDTTEQADATAAAPQGAHAVKKRRFGRRK